MEASRFSFGANTPPAFKFDPTDADLVAHYLIPRALGLPNPHAGAIIDDDPLSAAPWEVLKRHGHEGSDHAFFFGPPPTDASRGKTRAVPGGGGVWEEQRASEETITLERPGGGEVDIRYRRNNLAFSPAEGGPSAGAGYVMHEYQILTPPLPGTVLTAIKVLSLCFVKSLYF
jgi:hypothetical protein